MILIAHSVIQPLVSILIILLPVQWATVQATEMLIWMDMNWKMTGGLTHIYSLMSLCHFGADISFQAQDVKTPSHTHIHA
jgi:hypothetical protein